MCDEYKTKMKNKLVQYQMVLIQHTIFALKKIEKGKIVLCCYLPVIAPDNSLPIFFLG